MTAGKGSSSSRPDGRAKHTEGRPVDDNKDAYQQPAIVKAGFSHEDDQGKKGAAGEDSAGNFPNFPFEGDDPVRTVETEKPEDDTPDRDNGAKQKSITAQGIYGPFQKGYQGQCSDPVGGQKGDHSDRFIRNEEGQGNHTLFLFQHFPSGPIKSEKAFSPYVNWLKSSA